MGRSTPESAVEKAYTQWLTAAIDQSSAPDIGRAIRTFIRSEDTWDQFSKQDRRQLWQTGKTKNNKAFNDWGRDIRLWRDRASLPEETPLRRALVQVVQDLVPDPPYEIITETPWQHFSDVVNVLAAHRTAQHEHTGRKAQESASEDKADDVRGLLRASGRVDQLDPEKALGLGSWAFDTGIPPYVTRTTDDDLATTLQSVHDSVITVVGPPKAGKTRSVYQTLLETMPEAVCWWHNPRPGALPQLLEHLKTLRADNPLRPNVVVLDDAGLNGLDPQNGLTAARLTRLARLVETIIVIVHDSDLATWQDHASGGRAAGDLTEMAGIGASPELVAILNTHRIDYNPVLDTNELPRADTIIDGVADRARGLDLTRLAEAMASTDKFLDSATKALSSGGTRASLIEAAIDASIINRSGVTFELLELLARLHHRRIAPNSRWKPDDFAIDFDTWATHGFSPQSPHSILIRDPGNPDEDHYRLLDVLTPRLRTNDRDLDHLDNPTLNLTPNHYNSIGAFTLGSQIKGNPIRWWTKAATLGSSRAMFSLGAQAHDVGNPVSGRSAVDWWIQAAHRGDSDSMNNLGVLADQVGHPLAGKSAENWWLQAASHNNGLAMFNLGLLAHEAGQPIDGRTATDWWIQAAECGYADAMFSLGNRADKTGRPIGGRTATDWLILAAREDHVGAMYLLGRQATENGTAIANPIAIKWWTKASKLNHAEATYALGLMATKANTRIQGRTATDWWIQAAEHNHARAMLNLGVHADEAGQPIADRTASDWWLLAAELGEPDAMLSLGWLAHETEKKFGGRTATDWWIQAAEHNHAGAMFNLGVRADEASQPLADRTATDWWIEAAERGNADAMFNLGNRADRTGRPIADRTASDWWLLAAELGEPDAMLSLGGLARETEKKIGGRTATDWWIQATEHNHAGAMFNLGLLAHEAGQPIGGRTATDWWIQATEHNHAGAMNSLGILAYETGQEVGGQDAAQWLNLAANAGNGLARENSEELEQGASNSEHSSSDE